MGEGERDRRGVGGATTEGWTDHMACRYKVKLKR